MKASDIIDGIEKWAMPSLIDSWDNTGLQVGRRDKEVNKILIALDVDRPIVDKLIRGKYDMVISHHPLLFNPVNMITSDNYEGKLLLDLISNDIVVYNAHSNLDLAKGGVNDILAEKLKLRNIKDLNIVFSDEVYDYGYGRIGEIIKIDVLEYLDLIKEQLNISSLTVYGNIDKKVERVAVCGGSGSSFIEDAYEAGAEIYITGDIKYHDAQLGHELGMIIVDAGHFETEKLILPVLKDYILNNVNEDLNIDIIMGSSLPKQVY